MCKSVATAATLYVMHNIRVCEGGGVLISVMYMTIPPMELQ